MTPAGTTRRIGAANSAITKPTAWPSPTASPNFGAYVRSKGMKFGIWIEIENLGTGSDMFRKHPDWCLACDGHPLLEVRAMPDELRQTGGASLGARRAGPPGARSGHRVGQDRLTTSTSATNSICEPPGDASLSTTSWPTTPGSMSCARPIPDLIVENCSSGGLRFDLGIIAHTHTTWLSDQVLPQPCVQLAYGCTLEFAPQVCNHWMVGDRRQRRSGRCRIRPAGGTSCSACR